MQDKSALNLSQPDVSRSRDRLWIYRLLGLLSAVLFVSFMAAGLLAPAFDTTTRTLVLITETVALGVSLAVGAWKPAQSDAPITSSHKDTFLAAILLLQLVWCIVGVLTSVKSLHR
jgi:hypothetical protein